MIKASCFLFLCFVSSLVAQMDDFDRWMGKGTKHWDYVQGPKDITALDRYHELYKRNEGLRFSSQGNVKIPKTVHFIWLGPRQFPRESVENVRTWLAKNPDWKFKFWTDRPRPAPCDGMEVVLFTQYPFTRLARCYEQSENWGEKSDVLRFEILNHEGGVYVDHDANCLQPFKGLHTGYDLYCGLEAPHPDVAGFNITVGNGVIGARPGHPVVQKVIDLIDSRWDGLAEKYPGKDGFSRTQIVMERTYLALTLALQETMDLPGNKDIVFPAAYFFAKAGIPSLYSQHFFANAWAEGCASPFEHMAQKELAKIDKKTSRLFLFTTAAICFNLFLVGFGLRMIKKPRFL